MLARCVVLLALVLPAVPAAAQVERVERGNLRIEGIPEIPEALSQRMRQYQETRSAGFRGWMPGGGILVATRFGETTQLHAVERPGGARRQLTFSDEPTRSAAVNPNADAQSLLFQRDAGGSEFNQIFLFDLATGAQRMLTDGTSRNGNALWARRGDRFVYNTTQRNGRDTDLHVMTPDGTSTPVLEREGSWFAADWAPDDGRLLAVRYVSANETHPHVLDLASGALTPLHEGDEPVSYGGLRFDAAGTGIFYTSDEGSEFERLRHRDLGSGETRTLTPDIDWDVQGVELSPDGGTLAFTVNEEGYSRLYLLDTETGERRSVELPVGLISGLAFSPDGRHLGMSMASARTPGDAFSLDLEAQTLTRWTHSEVGGLDTEAFVEPELVRYPTFDGREIPAFVYTPEGPGPFPVVVSIHGGPEGQARPGFASTYQFWANELGLAVVVPNVRGSSGYGKSYLRLDNGRKREDSVRDIGALLDWIGEQPALDADRVAVFGGSYGGYMVLASMVHYNDRLRAGVDVVGISNFVTFLENTQDYRRHLRRAEYGDESDPAMRAFLESISPANHAERITKPLFVVQGLNDPRVPASESEQMVARIRENDGEVWYLLATDEGHGFRKKANRDYYTEAVALFFQRHLLGEAAP